MLLLGKILASFPSLDMVKEEFSLHLPLMNELAPNFTSTRSFLLSHQVMLDCKPQVSTLYMLASCDNQLLITFP